MNNELRGQIYENMNLKDTEELLDIWHSNDRAEWTDTALEIVREILIKRLGELPSQDDISTPDRNDDEEDNEPTLDELGLKGWEVKLIDAEEQPEFYDTWDAIDLIRKINKAAWWVLIIYVLTGILAFPTTQQIMTGWFPESSDIPSILLSLLTVVLGTVLGILATYFTLKALAYILRILMEMEFNSRK
mgnify:CR=1 FL=1